MQKIQQISGSCVPLLLDDIDTDRIIPARYLRCVTFDGLGKHAFEDDRKQDASHPFDDSRFANSSVLVSGRNFGCGSSREHAPQSLNRWGIHAVIAESFAEIFFGNCTALGIPAVCIARPELEKLTTAIGDDPQLEVTVDLDAKQVRYGDANVACEIPESACIALVTGEYDFLAKLLEGKPQIEQTVSTLPYMTNFA